MEPVIQPVDRHLILKELTKDKFIRVTRKGGNYLYDTSSILDNAEVNEQGFEIIQDGKTGLMRVANGGKRGTTRLNKGDTVYTPDPCPLPILFESLVAPSAGFKLCKFIVLIFKYD